MDARNTGREFSPDILEKVARLEYRARIIVEGLLTGQHKSPARGFNVEFLEHRPYYPGDDLRHVDWKVFARSDRYHVKQYEEETNLRAYIVLDASGSMDFCGRNGARKLSHARLMAAALGYMFIKQGDAVGLYVTGGGRETFLEPGSAHSHLHRLIAGMLEPRDTGSANLGRTLQVLSDRVRRRSILLMFSDLLEEPGPVRDSLKVIKGRGNELAIFHVLDETELDFPYTRASRFIDPETGRAVSADPTAVRHQYMKNLDGFISGYRDFCARIDAEYTISPTSRSAEEILFEFLEKRERRRRR